MSDGKNHGLRGTGAKPSSDDSASSGRPYSKRGTSQPPTVWAASWANTERGRWNRPSIVPSCSQLDAGVRTSSIGARALETVTYTSMPCRVMPSTVAPSGSIARHTIHWAASAISFSRYSPSVFISPNSPEFRTHSRAVAKNAFISYQPSRTKNGHEKASLPFGRPAIDHRRHRPAERPKKGIAILSSGAMREN